jgi:hypothetical protein
VETCGVSTFSIIMSLVAGPLLRPGLTCITSGLQHDPDHPLHRPGGQGQEDPGEF